MNSGSRVIKASELKGAGSEPSEWASTYLGLLGVFVVGASILVGILLFIPKTSGSGFWEEHPFALTGLIVGVSGVLQGMVLIAIANYMSAQEARFRTIQITLRNLDKELNKAFKGLSEKFDS